MRESFVHTLVLPPPGNLGLLALLRSSSLEYLGPIDLTQYYIRSWNMTSFDGDDGVSGVQVEIVLYRRLFSALITNYLPTVIICLVSFSTNYYRYGERPLSF